MNQIERKRSLLDRDGICADLLRMAQRELSALLKTVTELFGAEQAELSAQDWLHEVETRSKLPASAREWRQITVGVITQLADRCGQTAAMALSPQLQPASY